MFDQTFVNTHAHTRRPWTVAASLGLQTVLVAVILILPMLHPEFPHPKLEAPAQVWLKTLTRQPEPPVKTLERTAPASPRPVFIQPLLAPASVPRHISLAADAPPPDLPVGPASTSGPSPIAGFTPVLPERAPQPASVVKAAPLRIGGGVQAAKLMFAPKPRYSPLAIAAHIEGTVRIQAIIAIDGSIRNLQVMSGPPLLVNPAMEAVKQWRYQPTLLNGSPVEVITEIDVVFTLGH
jgi:protein TonB